ncbi:MAG: sigma factor regulator N-terminal domain-containing protein [Bacilli bacterium]|nr:sigma factor regulator N-terminal domain-containing protein [Bacilli bacterium]
MENEEKIKRIVRIIIISFIIIIAIIIGLHYLNKYLTKTNTKRFEKYLEDNNYSTDPNDEIYYTILKDDHILTKTTKLSEEQNSLIYVNYDSNGDITGTLELYGINAYGKQGISYLKSTYKNKKFDCQIITSAGLEAKCNLLKQETDKFEKEMKQILKKSKVNPKLIKKTENFIPEQK